MAVSKLYFGVEIEVLLSPRNNPDHTDFRKTLVAHGWNDHITSSPTKSFTQERQTNRLALRSALVDRLQAEGGIQAQTEEDFNDYNSWTISGENLSEAPTYWGVELTSRIMTTDEDWQGELAKMFRVVSKYCSVLLTWDCSMHVHVSPDRKRTFTDDQLQALCKGLCYYDKATTDALPGERKANLWATSNLELESVGDGKDLNGIQEAYKTVATGSWALLFGLLDGSITRADVCSTLQMSYNKLCAWNFVNICSPGGHGTVEFRRPPGVDSAQKAVHWAAFVLGLFAESLALDWAEGGFDEKFSQPSVVDMRSFIAGGLRRLGSNCEGALVEEWVVEDQSLAMSDDEKEAKIEEWAGGNWRLKVGWFEQGLVKYCPGTFWDSDYEGSSDDEDGESDGDDLDSSWSPTELVDVNLTWASDLEEHRGSKWSVWGGMSVECSPSPIW